MLHQTDTIVALSTPQGVGALAVIRVSGEDAIRMCANVFKGKDLTQQASHTIHFGSIHEDGKIIDEVLASVFRTPKSFTKENVVEISSHGSSFIIRKIIELLLKQGARLAEPGEFTKRAFINGKFDLAQAEAIADLINSNTEAAHRTALNQMRGGFSKEIKELREQLIHFASLIELELDFGEEDVEFASRVDLKNNVNNLLEKISALIDSFSVGNVIKNGVPTVIAGKPNVGKSTLLNALLNEERAIVSEIPGTTRDTIEDEVVIQGITFRFIDTAGLRHTTDTIEAIGVERTREKMKQASVILYMFDLSEASAEEILSEIGHLEELGIPFIKVGNKADVAKNGLLESLKNISGIIYISAKSKENLKLLENKIVEMVNIGHINPGQTIVTNVRHYHHLCQTRDALLDVLEGVDSGITGDFLALDIRTALHQLGEITGEITTEDLLENIFSKFCIGK